MQEDEVDDESHVDGPAGREDAREGVLRRAPRRAADAREGLELLLARERGLDARGGRPGRDPLRDVRLR